MITHSGEGCSTDYYSDCTVVFMDEIQCSVVSIHFFSVTKIFALLSILIITEVDKIGKILKLYSNKTFSHFLWAFLIWLILNENCTTVN